MAWQLIRTYTIPKESMELFYQVQDDFDITDAKIMTNNYEWNDKEDTVIIWAVWELWWALSWGNLTWIVTGNTVTPEEKDQHQLFRGTLKWYERYVEENIHLWDWDQIRVRSSRWYCNMMLMWKLNTWWSKIEDLKQKVLDGTITTAEKEELALLMWWIYVVQNNTNNCNCS